MQWRKFWIGKKPDGRPSAGLGLYMLLLVPFGVFVWWAKSGDSGQNAAVHGAPANVPRLAAAIKSTAPVAQPEVESTLRSERELDRVTEFTPKTEANAGPAIQSGSALEDAVNEAQQVMKERPAVQDSPKLPGAVDVSDGQRHLQMTDDTSAPQPGSLARIGPTAGGARRAEGGGGGGDGSIESLVIYHRKRPENKPAPSAPAPAPDPWAEGRFLPRGHRIPLYVLDEIRTNTVQPLIKCGVARDVKFHGRVDIPFGTKVLISTGDAGHGGLRITATPSSFQFLDGSEVSVSGVIKAEDGGAGIPAYYIPPPARVKMEELMNNFLGGYLAMLYDTQQRKAAFSVAGVQVSSGATNAFDPRLEAISSMSTVIQEYARDQMNEVKQRYGAHLVTPPGTPCFLELTSPCTLTVRGVNVAPLAEVKGKEETGGNIVNGLPPALQDVINKVGGASKAISREAQTELNTALRSGR